MDYGKKEFFSIRLFPEVSEIENKCGVAIIYAVLIILLLEIIFQKL